MAKQGEIDYPSRIGASGLRHAAGKPFSDAYCPNYLMQMGALLSLLPPPPARLLDLGCGAGWTSVFFAKRGYEVLGVDIAADMIAEAKRCQEHEGLDNLQFLACDYEALDFEADFDAAVFFDALHHAVDEELALRQAYRALRPGGVCVTSEPGEGHAQSPAAVAAVQQYGVTEKDMPPQRIIAAGRNAGFRRFRVYPHAFHLAEATYHYTGKRLRPLAERWPAVQLLGSFLALARAHLLLRRRVGIVVLTK